VPFLAVAVNEVAVVDVPDKVAVNFNAVEPVLPSANLGVAVDRLKVGKVAMIFLGLKKGVFRLYAFILEFSNYLLEENVKVIGNANQGKIGLIFVCDENHKFI
jgi:hypothetical protein